MVDIFDEVSEDLRNERALALARRYGALLLTACLFVLVGVAAEQGWEWYQTKQNAKAATTYLNLTNALPVIQGSQASAQNEAAAAALVNFAATAPEGYKTLADLRAAALYASAGQTTQAANLWNTVGADTNADPLLSDLANLLWAQHMLGIAPDGDVLSRLSPLAEDNNPYHGLAREAQALIYLREGKPDLAKAIFTQIAGDPAVPDGLRNRAYGLLAKLNG